MLSWTVSMCIAVAINLAVGVPPQIAFGLLLGSLFGYAAKTYFG